LIYDDVGEYLEHAISEFAKSKNLDLQVSYIDPTYAIRSVASNPSDTYLCT